MNEEKYNIQKIVNWGNGIALGFSVLGVLVIFVIVFMLFSKTPPIKSNVNKFEINYAISIDTVQLKKLKDINSIEYLRYVEENNKKVAADLEEKINDEYKRIQKLIELKEEQNIYNTYGAGIIALILAVGSFFGFKSINEMKKNAIDTAEEEARKVAEEEARTVATITANEVALETAEHIANIRAEEISKEEISKQIDSIKDELERKLKGSLKAENKKEVEKGLSEKMQEIGKLKTEVNNLINKLNIALSKAEINDTEVLESSLPLSEEGNEEGTEENEGDEFKFL